jgi:GNAT superfamily N-acetyltransferase
VIDVRPATVADADALAELRWEFRAGRDEAVEDRSAFLARCAEWMRRELAGTAWRAWVAVRDGRIVGQVWLQVVRKMPNPIGERDRHGYLSNLYVMPSERGGIGTRLLRSAIDWAAADRVDRVVLWPSAQSVTLYARHGFTRQGDVMELRCAASTSR